MSFKKLIPESLLSAYHLAVALLGDALYGFPSRRIRVIGVTGTKGKTSTTEMISSIFEAAGEKTALINSIRIKIDQKKTRNAGGRSMPGRARLQRFLRSAVRAGCSVAIIEMTSEGARQHRHRGIELDGLVFLNLAPEHIESHGSYEAYSDAKFELGKAQSSPTPTTRSPRDTSRSPWRRASLFH
jgi:UDP-N-acetylmuramoyl-L-alanyl-D-glutamate--2,6-diaminopimelate ligase